MSILSKLNLIALVLGLAVAAANPARAEDKDEGTRGGGEYVKTAAYYELRDLLDKTTCDWRSGDDMIAEVPEVKTVLAKIAKVDWYFAMTVEREIKKLDWCMTGELVKIDTNDRESMTVRVDIKTKQAAIRMLDGTEVYVDQDLFEGARSSTQAFTILHETLHSLIDLKEKMRNTKLRSAVKSLYRVANGSIRTRAQLYNQLAHDGVNFPMATNLLDPFKSFVTYVLGNDEQRQAILAGQSDIEAFFAQADKIVLFDSALNADDHVQFQNVTSAALIGDLCSAGVTPATQALISRPDLSIYTLETCLSAATDAPALRSLILKHPRFSTAVEGLMTDLTQKSFSVVENRLLVSSAVQALSSNDLSSASDLVFTSLTPVALVGTVKFNPQGEMFYQFVKTLLENNQWDVLNAKVIHNDLFYSAFSMDFLKEQIEGIATPILREKPLAKAMLDEIPQAFWAAFLARLERELGPVGEAQVNQFKNQVDWNSLDVGGSKK